MHYVNVLVSGSKYQPAPDAKEVEEADIPQYKTLAKESENMLYKCNEVLKDIDHTRSFDNHNQFLAKWVGSSQQRFITPSEKNSAKVAVYKRSTSKTLKGNDPMIKLRYDAQINREKKYNWRTICALLVGIMLTCRTSVSIFKQGAA